MTTDLRVLEPDQWDEWYDRLNRAFGGPAEPEELRGLWRDLTETDRSLAVWDEGRVAGTAGAFSFRMAVPGGAVVPAAGVTMVSVQPTHRRQGVLTAMMRRQLDDVRERGEPVAVLTASESAIYGRFGYGCASWALSAAVDTTRVRLTAPGLGDGVRLRVARPADVVAECEAVYAALVPGRPGMLERQPGWDRVPRMDDPLSRGAAGELLCVLAERDGRVSGYARYATTGDWEPGGPAGKVVLRDLDALDPATRTALWRYLFGVDLMTSVRVRNRPVDDPLFGMVTDVRSCLPTLREGLFARLVDVGEALSARTYGLPLDVVLEVEDAFCPWNAGRWRLSGDASGAVCERTSDPAELALSVRELGAAYLGGTPLNALAAAGRVRELRAGSLAAVSAGFRSAVEPWLPHGF